jgi:hypothetical protein
MLNTCPADRNERNGIMAASLVLMATIVGGSLAGRLELFWPALAVYTAVPVLTAVFLVTRYRFSPWLLVAAVALAIFVVFPGALLDYRYWSTEQLWELGWIASLFLMVLILSVRQLQTSRLWLLILTGYLFLMSLLAFLI